MACCSNGSALSDCWNNSFCNNAAADWVWWQLGVGAMSVLAAVMTALQTTLRYQELAEKHREAGARYNALGREIELLLSYSDLDLNVVSEIRGAD
ncbi:SLATT domain-containing protein [Pseudomonas chlororaphis]|uniref:SLATT domain-containing protein n=1 Tax=Pseudomonas chlororaphis TaxID=587753 RepID=UPI0039E1CAF8